MYYYLNPNRTNAYTSTYAVRERGRREHNKCILLCLVSENRRLIITTILIIKTRGRQLR